MPRYNEPKLCGQYLRVLVNTPTTKLDKLLADTLELDGHRNGQPGFIPFSFGEIGCEGHQVLHAPAFSPNGLFGSRPVKQNRLNSVAVLDIEPWNGINVVAQFALLIVIPCWPRLVST